MSNQSFAKYEGAGNDFVIIDDRALNFPCNPPLIRKLCDRKFGIGADGLILLQPNVRMRIFNRDGYEAEGCGNGVRCLARFLADLGIKGPYPIAVHDRVVEAVCTEDGVSVAMGEARDIRLNLQTERGLVHFVDTGVPHAVLFLEKVEGAPLETLGPFLRHHPLFGPRGANANLAAIQPDRSVRVRTFERGVEGETLACGTGACAVAAIVEELYGWPTTRICYPGGDLEVKREGGSLFMTGPANRVFTGFYPMR